MIVIGPCGRHLQDFSPCEREGDGGASNRVGEETEEVMASLPRIFRSRKKSRALRNNFITETW